MPEPSPFDSLEASFRLLCAGPSPLAVHGREIGPPFPPRPIPLTELGAILLHPATPYDARDCAMRLLVRRAQRHSGAWTVGVAGLLLPGLRAAVAPLAKAYPSAAADLEADVLVELVDALASFDSRTERVASRLLWRAAQRARRRLVREQAGHGRRGDGVPPVEPQRPWGHPDFVLAEAVTAEAISADDAALIGDTRLGGVPVSTVAARAGRPAGSIRKRRARAERRLLHWLGARDVACRETRAGASFGGAGRSPVADQVGPGQLAHPASEPRREVTNALRPASATGAARPAHHGSMRRIA